MTRPNYSTNIAGSVKLVDSYPLWNGVEYVIHSDTSNYNVPIAMHSEESVSGVHRRKPVGWIPPTGYTLYHRQFRLATGSALTRSKLDPRYTSQYSGVIGGGMGVDSYGHWDATCLEAYYPAGLDTRSLIAARNKLKNGRVNLGNAYGERKQLAHQLGDTATRLARAVRQLRRGEIRQAMRALGISAKKGKPRGSNWTDHWLALQYGWKPLLADIHGAADALSKRPKGDWIVTAKGTAFIKDRFTQTFTGPNSGSCVAEVLTSTMTRIDAVPQNEAIISLASLGILNPLEVAWEVTPFSFVVDWFLPIGDWLNGMDAMLGYTSAYTSISSLQKMKWTGKGKSSSTTYQTFVNSYSESKSIVRLSRSASSGVPIPSMPPLKDGRSLGHMANGLALLSQAFGRAPRSAKSILGRNPGRPFIARYGTV